MANNQAVAINLSEKQEKILEQLHVGSHSPLHYKLRSGIILLASKGKSNNEIERTMQIGGEMITLWRNRFAAAENELAKTEAENPRKLRSVIEKLLSDTTRSGRPPTFTDVQVANIIALSLQNPSELKLPFSHWTSALLKDEVIRRGIVSSISESQIRFFLKGKGFKAASI
jgi:putative transposase